MKRSLLFFLIGAAASLSACAPSSGALEVNDVWARPARTGENGAVYLTIENGTDSDDTLIGADTEVAMASETHMSTVDDQGVMSMQRHETTNVPAGERVEFKPGSLHIMLVNLKQDLKIGDTFTLNLQFQNAGELSFPVEVKELP